MYALAYTVSGENCQGSIGLVTIGILGDVLSQVFWAIFVFKHTKIILRAGLFESKDL